MAKLNLLNSRLLDIVLSRLSQQVIENHGNLQDTVMLGMQPRGIYLAERLKARIAHISGVAIPLGYLDTTFDRDDFRRRAEPLRASETKVPFLIENKQVLLVDDVLYTGRSVRAAMSAMSAFGRPASVELLTLIDRKYSRDIPVQANYVGKSVNTVQSQKVLVEWAEQGFAEDNIWLIDK